MSAFLSRSASSLPVFSAAERNPENVLVTCIDNFFFGKLTPKDVEIAYGNRILFWKTISSVFRNDTIRNALPTDWPLSSFYNVDVPIAIYVLTLQENRFNSFLEVKIHQRDYAIVREFVQIFQSQKWLLTLLFSRFISDCNHMQVDYVIMPRVRRRFASNRGARYAFAIEQKQGLQRADDDEIQTTLIDYFCTIYLKISESYPYMHFETPYWSSFIHVKHPKHSGQLFREWFKLFLHGNSDGPRSKMWYRMHPVALWTRNIYDGNGNQQRMPLEPHEIDILTWWQKKLETHQALEVDERQPLRIFGKMLHASAENVYNVQVVAYRDLYRVPPHLLRIKQEHWDEGVAGVLTPAYQEQQQEEQANDPEIAMFHRANSLYQAQQQELEQELQQEESSDVAPIFSNLQMNQQQQQQQQQIILPETQPYLIEQVSPLSPTSPEQSLDMKHEFSNVQVHQQQQQQQQQKRFSATQPYSVPPPSPKTSQIEMEEKKELPTWPKDDLLAYIDHMEVKQDKDTTSKSMIIFGTLNEDAIIEFPHVAKYLQQEIAVKITTQSPLNNNSLQTERNMYMYITNVIAAFAPHVLPGIHQGQTSDAFVMDWGTAEIRKNDPVKHAFYKQWITLRANAIFKTLSISEQAKVKTETERTLAQNATVKKTQNIPKFKPIFAWKHMRPWHSRLNIMYYIVTPRMKGQRLSEFIQSRAPLLRSKFKSSFKHNIEAFQMNIGMQIAQTLAVFEKAKIRHNDLHMQNIFIEEFINLKSIKYTYPSDYELKTHYVVTMFDFDRAGAQMESPMLQNSLLSNVFCREIGTCNEYVKNWDWHVFLVLFIRHLMHSNYPFDKLLNIIGPRNYVNAVKPVMIGTNAAIGMPCKCIELDPLQSSAQPRCASCQVRYEQLEKLESPITFFERIKLEFRDGMILYSPS